MTKDELIRELFTKYGLVYDSTNPDSRDNDIFIHKHYKVITRSGLQKIEKATGIQIEFDAINASCGCDWAVVRATGSIASSSGTSSKRYTTFGSANTLNCKNGYYAEMAEKRARSRIILTLAGLYELGFYGNVEMSGGDDEEEVKRAPQVEKRTMFREG